MYLDCAEGILLIPWSRVLEKGIVSQLDKNEYSSYYELS
jgi:hypothetical protein